MIHFDTLKLLKKTKMREKSENYRKLKLYLVAIQKDKDNF